MSSWRSSSSKSIFESDGMFDLEDQLDYEPDGIENEDENSTNNDVIIAEREANTFSFTGNNEEEESDKEENYLEDEDDDRVQVPEPSGLEDYTNDTSSERRSLSYGTNLERAPSQSPSITPSVVSSRAASVTPSFRDKMNYIDLHIDVEAGSCQSKYGHYMSGINMKFIDSSSEDEEYSPDALINPDATAGKSTVNLNREDSFLESQQENMSYENYPSSSELYDNMISPGDIVLEDSLGSSASSRPVDSTNGISFSQAIQNKSGISPWERQTTITGSVRDVLPTSIQNNSIDSPRRKPATIVSESIRNISPNLEQITQNNVKYLPRKQQTMVSTKNRRNITPNLEYVTQNNAAGSLRGKQMTIRNESRSNISPALEQLTQNETVDLPRRKQTIVVTRNRNDISPNLGYVTQSNSAESLRDRQVAIRTETKETLSTDLSQAIENDAADLQQINIRTDNRSDSWSDSVQNIQNDVMKLPRKEQLVVNTNRHSFTIQNKATDPPRGKQISFETGNKRTISTNLGQEKNATDALGGNQLTIKTRNKRAISTNSDQVIEKGAEVTIEEERRIVSPELEYSALNAAPDSPRSEQTYSDSDSNTSQDFTQSNNNPAVSPRGERKSLNFKIQVEGNKRIFIQPKQVIIKRPPKPWRTVVEDYMDDSDVVLLNSQDAVVKPVPEVTKSNVKTRLGEYPDNKSHSSESVSDTGFSVFKVPLKRPPTRPKVSGKNISVSVDLKSQQWQVNNVEPPAVSQKDDIISIMAGSDLSLAEDLDEYRDRMNDFSVKEEPASLPGSIGTEQRKLERTAQWINQALEPRRQQQIPDIYKGLCYKYFLYNGCNNSYCQRSHLLISPKTQIDQLPFLTILLLREAYEFAMENPFLYGLIYKHFANAFALKDIKGELIKMITIIFEETCYKIRPEEGLEVILGALQKTNLGSFEAVIDYVLLQIGLKRYPTLGSVLFEIILNKLDVSEHWPITKRLVIAGVKMSLKQGSKFLIHLMKSPVNLKVCQEVYRHILMYKFVDLPKISLDIREQFLKTCSQDNISRQTAEIEANIERNLRKERLNYENSVDNNDQISIQPPQVKFSVPLLPALGRTQLPTSQNYLQQSEFGYNSSSNKVDFATLCQNSSPFATQLPVDDQMFDSTSVESSLSRRRSHDDGKGQTNESFHDVDLRYQRPPTWKQGHNNNGSSDGDRSPHFSDSESSTEPGTAYVNPGVSETRKRPAPAGLNLMYNREGLHYDPANDYQHSTKRRIAEPIGEFDRLKLSSKTFVRQNFDDQSASQRLNSDWLTLQRENLSEEAVYRQNREDNETRPVVNRENHREMLQRRASFEDETTEPATHRPHREYEEALNLRPNPIEKPVLHRYEEASNLRPNHVNPIAKPMLRRPKFFLEATGPSSRRHDVPVLKPGFHRLTAEVDKGLEPLFARPSHVVEEARPAISRPHDTDQRVRPSRHRPLLEMEAADEDLRNQPLRAQRGIASASTSRIELTVTSSDAAVSSSSDARLKDEKPPEHPQFGKMYFDPHYEFNVSLHNLYLEAIDNVDINEEDVHRLNDCIKNCDGELFLKLIDKYKGPKTVQNFISMTLANLKGMNQMIARTYRRLLHIIEIEDPHFYGKRYIRVILEVITMNLLFELNNRNMLDEAYILLNRFSDWDSLVTSRILIFNDRISIIGRYLFIANLLVHSKPELTFEILACPTLHLLGKYENWPYIPSCPIPEIFNKDLDTRNTVISMFLKKGYLLNPVSVIQFYKVAFKKEIWNFDVKLYVSPMLMDLINKNHASLKLFINEIKQFQKFMTKDMLRAFLICLCKQRVSEKELFMLYERCVEAGIYQRLVRGEIVEYVIEIKTNWHVSEIELLIKYYFQKLEEIRKVPPGSEPLRFEIKLPGESLNYRSLPLLNTNKSLILTTEIVKTKIEKHFSVSTTCLQPGSVEVKKEELVKYLDRQWT